MLEGPKTGFVILFLFPFSKNNKVFEIKKFSKSTEMLFMEKIILRPKVVPSRKKFVLN